MAFLTTVPARVARRTAWASRRRLVRYPYPVSHLLGVENATVIFPTRTVLDQVTLGLNAGDRIGIVGLNGSGKTTLARIMTGASTPDSGKVVRRRGVTVGYLTQDDDLPDTDVLTAVVGHEPEHVWASNPRTRGILSGLLADVPLTTSTRELSGGQKRRVALAALLAEDWDVLVLDEPTNHLDLQGIAWLADHLHNRWRKGEGALVTVTHDRWFLDAVTNQTWEVGNGSVESFDGGYAEYTLRRVERDRMARVAEEKRQNLLRKELAWLRRGAPARTAKPKFRIEAANELISNVPEPRDKVKLSQLAMARLGKRVVDLVDVGFSYEDDCDDTDLDTPPENLLFEDVTWRLAPGERSALLGLNGTGKTTLLRLLTGELKPTAGHVRQGKTVKIGFLDQQFSQLEEVGERRVREVIGDMKQALMVDGVEVTPASLLEQIGFSRADLSQFVNALSGGQKRRLQLLLVLASEPNVLVLDEPTNDVDTDFLTALEDLLDSWPGTLIVVSHDRYLLERVTDDQHALINGTLRHVPGGIDQYLALLDDSKTAPDRAAHNSDGVGTESPSKSDSSPHTEGSNLSGAELYQAQKEMASLERRMEHLSNEITSLNQKMATWDQTDFQGLTEIAGEVRELTKEHELLEEQWLEIAEKADG